VTAHIRYLINIFGMIIRNKVDAVSILLDKRETFRDGCQVIGHLGELLIS
jgi:hypothetical protein